MTRYDPSGYWGRSTKPAATKTHHATDAGAPSEPQAPEARCAVATCSLPVLSAEAFSGWLRARSAKLMEQAKQANARGDWEVASVYQSDSCTLDEADEAFRREMGLPAERQPAENTEMSRADRAEKAI